MFKMQRIAISLLTLGLLPAVSTHATSIVAGSGAFMIQLPSDCACALAVSAATTAADLIPA